MRHCTQTSENMRVRIWALLRRRDVEQPSAGIGGDVLDQEEGMPGLIPDPAPAEQKQEAPTMRREGEPPPVGMAASASEPPDEVFLEEAAATGPPPERGRAGWSGYSGGQDTQRYEEAAAMALPQRDAQWGPPTRHDSCARCFAPHHTSECPVPWALTRLGPPQAMELAERLRDGCSGCGGAHDIRDCYVVDHCLQNKGWTQRYRRQICYGCGGPHHLKRCRLSPATKDAIWATVRLQCVFRTWRMFLQRGAAVGGNVPRRLV